MEVSRSDKGLAATTVALLVAPGLVVWSRLPEPLATHWGPGGTPDGHLPRWGWLLGTVFVLGLVWAVYLVVREQAPSTWKPPFTLGIAGGMIVAQLSIVERNLDAPVWTAARTIAGPWMVVAFLGGWLVFGLLVYAIERR